MSSITATFGAYVITKAKDAKITVTKDGEVCSNAKQAIREIAEEAGFEVDPAWNTQTAGAKLIKFLLTDLAAEDLLEYDPCDLDGDGKVTFDEKIQYGLKQASEKAGLIMGEAKEIGKAFCDKASAKTKVVAAAVQAKVQGLKDSTIFQQKNNELFYIESLMDWLKEVCIIETDDEIYYDAESSEKEDVQLFINNLKAQNVKEENELLEKLSFKTVEDFISYLDEDEDDLCLAQKMVAAAYCTRKGIEINDDTELYVDEQLYYFNDSRDFHYEYSVDIDLG